MRKSHLVLVMLAFTVSAAAQDAKSFLLNLYGGYTFSDRVEFDNSHGYVRDGFEYGVGLEYFFMENSSVELKYNRLDTQLPLYGPLGEQLNAGDDDGAINYILVDYTRYFDASDSVLPYVGAGLGAAVLETPQSGSGTYFAWEIKAGVKVKTNSLVSINFNAYLQSMTSAVGEDYYWTYYGLVGVSDYVSTYQFGLGAVLSFDFNHQAAAPKQ